MTEVDTKMGRNVWGLSEQNHKFIQQSILKILGKGIDIWVKEDVNVKINI